MMESEFTDEKKLIEDQFIATLLAQEQHKWDFIINIFKDLQEKIIKSMDATGPGLYEWPPFSIEEVKEQILLQLQIEVIFGEGLGYGDEFEVYDIEKHEKVCTELKEIIQQPLKKAQKDLVNFLQKQIDLLQDLLNDVNKTNEEVIEKNKQESVTVVQKMEVAEALEIIINEHSRLLEVSEKIRELRNSIDNDEVCKILLQEIVNKEYSRELRHENDYINDFNCLLSVVMVEQKSNEDKKDCLSKIDDILKKINVLLARTLVAQNRSQSPGGQITPRFAVYVAEPELGREREQEQLLLKERANHSRQISRG